MAERLAQLRRVASQIRHPWRLEVDGLDRLPEDALILAVNRVGPTDHLNVAASLGRPTTVVIQPEWAASDTSTETHQLDDRPRFP